MKYLMVIAFTDLSDGCPRVHVEPFESATDIEARAHVESLQGNEESLMDLLVDGWREMPELGGLIGEDLLRGYGLRVGDLEAWCGERLIWFAPGEAAQA